VPPALLVQLARRRAAHQVGGLQDGRRAVGGQHRRRAVGERGRREVVPVASLDEPE
jgi:hypothetical protein